MTSPPNQRTIWIKQTPTVTVQVIDQRQLPHQLVVMDLLNVNDVVMAIKEMVVRGAPLIGATAAYGVYFACLEALNSPNSLLSFEISISKLKESRPTAINLFWAIERQLKALGNTQNFEEKAAIALENANAIVEEDVEICRKIGERGLSLLEEISLRKNGDTVHILTHCNAGRLGCIEWGTATAPIYLAHQKGINVHVWVDETRPRNQGASLTAWELGQAGVPHTLIVDNAGGHLMQHRMVDLVIVGTDRTTRKGDVANKIGTYLKALAANDNQIPFYVALPSTTIDWKIYDGLKEIPIEERSSEEVTHIQGWTEENQMQRVRLAPENTQASNYGFDVTPARLITGLITEKGICEASEEGLLKLFPEKRMSIYLD